ncbi:hypothetical protein Neosp_013879 [[Neocosmospora] mangrovei]
MGTPSTAGVAVSNTPTYAHEIGFHDPQPLLNTTDEGQGTQESEKPTVVGLYGVPGSGKSSMLNYLRENMSFSHFAFYEGSEVIDSLVPGGLEAFQALGEQRKAAWRGRAIEKIKNDALAKETMAIATAQFMHWPEEQAVGQPVYSVDDFRVFTHIIYLNTPAEYIFQRQSQDERRAQPLVSVEHLRKWQEAEITGLRHICFQSGILFHVLTNQATLYPTAEDVVAYLRDTRTQECNDCLVIERLDEFYFDCGGEELETALVLDADNTFASSDMNSLLWKAVDRILPRSTSASQLKEILDDSLDFSYTALRQTALLLAEVADEDQYDALCEAVASSVEVNPRVVSLLRAASEHPHIFRVVVTQGPALIWEKVLKRLDLYTTVNVLGGDEISTGFVISPISKGRIVHHLREKFNLYVWAFGKRSMDLMMLKEANEAVILAGDEQDGNPSTEFISAMESITSCNKTMMPTVRLGDPDFVKSVVRHTFEMVHATEKGAAKLLPFSISNAYTANPIWTEAHRSVGVYLALEYVSELIGLEKHPMAGKQDQQLSDYRLRDEQRTLIVTITTGGEPMACGINETFPCTNLISGATVPDINDLLQDKKTVILVAPAIDSGQTMMEHIGQIRKTHRQIRIVVVVGIVNAKVTNRDHDLNKMMRRLGASLVALRVSEDDFIGTEPTDTDNQLLTGKHEMDLS